MHKGIQLPRIHHSPHQSKFNSSRYLQIQSHHFPKQKLKVRLPSPKKPIRVGNKDIPTHLLEYRRDYAAKLKQELSPQSWANLKSPKKKRFIGNFSPQNLFHIPKSQGRPEVILQDYFKRKQKYSAKMFNSNNYIKELLKGTQQQATADGPNPEVFQSENNSIDFATQFGGSCLLNDHKKFNSIQPYNYKECNRSIDIGKIADRKK